MPGICFFTFKTIIMKKGILSLFVFASLAVFVSCNTNECYTCDLFGIDTEICEEDYPDNESFELAIDALEVSGATCTKN